MYKKVLVSKSVFILTIINTLFLFFVCFVFFNTKNNSIIVASPEKFIFPYIVVSFVIHLSNFLIRKYSIYEFGLWFIIISYLFLFGLVFRSVFSFNYNLLWDPIYSYSNKELFNSYFFALIALNFFSFGYFLTKKNDYIDLNNYEIMDNNKSYQMLYFGLILVIIGGISMIINDIHLISVIKQYNSYIAFKYALNSGILDDLAFLFLPGLFLLLFSGKLSSNQKKIIFWISFVYFIIIMILTGSRKTKLFYIISLFLSYLFSKKVDSVSDKKIKISHVIVVIFLSFIIVNLLVTIRDNRFMINNVLPAFYKNVFNIDYYKNIFGEVCSETGLTLLSIASIIKTVPSVFPFQYGITFIKTIPSFLPIGWLVGDFFDGASSTNIINSYLGLPVGSSLFGDLYWNFGLIGGFISSLIIGMLFGKIFNINQNINNRISCAIYFCFFSELIVLVRAEFFDIFRHLIFIVIISFILNKTIFPLRRRMNDE